MRLQFSVLSYNDVSQKTHQENFSAVKNIFQLAGLQDSEPILEERDWKVDFLRYQGFAGYAHAYLFGCHEKGQL